MVKRFLRKAIEESLQDTPVIMILGARQTGKSTFCKQLIEDGIFDGNVVTMDDPSVLFAAKTDPMSFLTGLGENVVIDEIQRVPEIFLSLKKLIDENRDRRVILTGSADAMLLPKVADSLAGRMETHLLWPFSIDEIKEKKSNFLTKLTSEDSDFISELTSWEEIIEMILRGGYPEVVGRDSERRRKKWLKAYLKSLLQKDIRDLANIDGLLHLPKILNLLSVRIGSTVNMSGVARLAGVKNTSFQRYMALLEQIFLIVKVPAWTPNKEGQFVKSPKLFLNDTGLLCNLMDDGKNLLNDRTQAGHVFENFVTMEIIKQISWHDEDLKPLHFSIHKGTEVDLVLEDSKKQLYGIEIKSKMSLKKDDFLGLKKLEELAGKKFKKGILIYTGEHALSGFGGKNLHAVPVSNIWHA